MKYTFFYVVGGQDIYYQQLLKSIRSLSRTGVDFKVKVLDFSSKLDSFDNVEVIKIDKQFDFNSQRHIFYQYKYYICQQLDTDRGIFLDCDTVMCYDKIEETFGKIGEDFGAIKHFGIYDFNDSFYYFGENYKQTVKEFGIQKTHDVTGKELFLTGGVFFFSNNSNSSEILKNTFDIHNLYYRAFDSYINGLFDETFLSIVASKFRYKLVHASSNHCCANLMPLLLNEEKEIIGGNPGDEDFEKIGFFHGFSDRQILGLDYSGELQKKIQEIWNI